MSSIDLNCDMGEGMVTDADIMPFISSANIACGYHAGDRDTMRRTIECAMKYNVAIGAHPSYQDRENFGRIDLLGHSLKHEEIPSLIIEQVQPFLELCNEMGAVMHHVKPHGALYNRAAKDKLAASLICSAIKKVKEDIWLYGLSGSEMSNAAEATHIRFAHEVFADRSYQDDGSLTPRSQHNALIKDANASIRQVLQMVNNRSVSALSGKTVFIKAETICIHGDTEHALAFAKAIHQTLTENHIVIQAP